jgi:hypothetical protein
MSFENIRLSSPPICEGSVVIWCSICGLPPVNSIFADIFCGQKKKVTSGIALTAL